MTVPASTDATPDRDVTRGAPRRRRRVGFLAVLVAVAVTGGLLARSGAGEVARRPAEVPQGGGALEVTRAVDPGDRADHGPWTVIERAPLRPRARHAAVWADGRLLVWGGVRSRPGGPQVFERDGAAYDPEDGSWRWLPDAPLDARAGHVGVWTAGELVVWGGTGRDRLFSDGAAYDPRTDRWRTLAPAPMSPRDGATGVWTGSELVVVGGADRDGPLRDAAAYDPVGDAWRVLPPPPLPGATGVAGAAAAGDLVVVWGGDGPAVAAYDREADRWQALPRLPRAARALRTLVWTGDALVAVGPHRLLRWAPGAQAWEALASPPALEGWDLQAAWTGDRLVAVSGGTRFLGGVYDPHGDVWEPLPGPGLVAARHPGSLPPAVWTGERLLLWGGSPYTWGAADEGQAGLAWRP